MERPFERAVGRMMNKRNLTEQEIRSRFIRPALVAAGWDDAAIREEYYCTDGRMEVTGETARRGERKFIDNLLVYSAMGDGFLEHDRLAVYGPVETELSDDDFPSPSELWRRYQLAEALPPGARTSAPACTILGNER